MRLTWVNSRSVDFNEILKPSVNSLHFTAMSGAFALLFIHLSPNPLNEVYTNQGRRQVSKEWREKVNQSANNVNCMVHFILPSKQMKNELIVFEPLIHMLIHSRWVAPMLLFLSAGSAVKVASADVLNVRIPNRFELVKRSSLTHSELLILP
ncbi:hypothetical protein EGR_03021 [Echinococcus granulosus]|uniref:Uncharacterized protein n=1 Tax=Echinococcus granulosus TaxID=6210 RepID=W6UKE9_ECHGR|nr:hypothetical protein EGR_03021 [Echinococcus granulosus]EUB62000.1 hypothetical protein EGR_03021 [Echinococcus granulosus]